MKIPDIIKLAARNLRNNSTPSEIILWNHIKNWKLGIKFLRQKPIYVFTENSWLDRFIIPDFYCFEKKIIIEIDWSIHDLKDVYNLDEQKEELLLNLGIQVIRFTNDEIKNNVSDVTRKIKSNHLTTNT